MQSDARTPHRGNDNNYKPTPAPGQPQGATITSEGAETKPLNLEAKHRSHTTSDCPHAVQNQDDIVLCLQSLRDSPAKTQMQSKSIKPTAYNTQISQYGHKKRQPRNDRPHHTYHAQPTTQATLQYLVYNTTAHPNRTRNTLHKNNNVQTHNPT